MRSDELNNIRKCLGEKCCLWISGKGIINGNRLEICDMVQGLPSRWNGS